METLFQERKQKIESQRDALAIAPRNYKCCAMVKTVAKEVAAIVAEGRTRKVELGR